MYRENKFHLKKLWHISYYAVVRCKLACTAICFNGEPCVCAPLFSLFNAQCFVFFFYSSTSSMKLKRRTTRQPWIEESREKTSIVGMKVDIDISPRKTLLSHLPALFSASYDFPFPQCRPCLLSNIPLICYEILSRRAQVGRKEGEETTFPAIHVCMQGFLCENIFVVKFNGAPSSYLHR